MDREELSARTKRFALRILKLADAIPNKVSGRAIANQVVRSGTSVASNYRAARRARSRKEFVAKLGVVVEEADETAFWLELVIEHELLPDKKVEPLHCEAEALTKIFSSMRRTAKSKPLP